MWKLVLKILFLPVYSYFSDEKVKRCVVNTASKNKTCKTSNTSDLSFLDGDKNKLIKLTLSKLVDGEEGNKTNSSSLFSSMLNSIRSKLQDLKQRYRTHGFYERYTSNVCKNPSFGGSKEKKQYSDGNWTENLTSTGHTI